MSAWAEDYSRFCAAMIRPPDRRPIAQWLEDERFSLPGSLRSERFRLDISPWLRLPFELCDDSQVRRLLVIGAVQTSKSTLGEGFIGHRLATDPGNMLYNWEDDSKAEEIWNERIEKTIRQARTLQFRLPDAKVKQRKLEMIFRDGMYFRMQGAKAKGNRQSKSVRYLVNEEIKDWEPGALTDMRNRATASWNSFELNITPGGMFGDETHRLWQESSQHVFHVRCPQCQALQKPRFRSIEGKPGGLHICDRSDAEALALCKPEPHVYNYAEIQRHIFYECESTGCGHRWRDTPEDRQAFVASGEYVPQNPNALPSDKGVMWNALICPWIPWAGLMREFHTAVRAMRLGDISLYKDFVQKREAEFFDESEQSEDDPDHKLQVSAGVTKSREGLPDRYFRGMAADKQRGEARKGDTPHYWVVIRDWKIGASALLWEGRVELDEDLEALRLEYDVPPPLVWVDSGDGMTVLDVYRMCAKYGYTAIKGEARTRYTHQEGLDKVSRRYSPEQVATVTGSDGGQYNISLVLYSKQGIRDLLQYARTSADFEYQIPEDVSPEYRAHNEAERLVSWHIPKTGQEVKIWRQFKKRNDLFVCECYQALLAEVMGIIGAVEVEERPEELQTGHKYRG